MQIVGITGGAPAALAFLHRSGMEIRFAVPPVDFLAVCLVHSIGGSRARKSGHVADIESSSQKWS